MFVLLIMQIMAQSDDGDVIDCVDMYHQPALIKRAPLEKSTEILQVSILQILRCLSFFADADFDVSIPLTSPDRSFN